MQSSKLLWLMTLNVIGVLSDQIITPCKSNDEVCMTKSAKLAWPKLTGIPFQGAESSDPLFFEEIAGDLSILKFKFTNTTVKGIKDCDINKVNLNLDKSTLHFELTCSMVMDGDYTIGGRLIILPVEGSGKYNIIAKKYVLTVDAEIKKIDGKDGKTHLNIKNFKVKAEPQDNIIFKFDNLFNGQKDLSDAVHKFANENYKEVSDFVEAPIFGTVFKKIVGIGNKYLKTVPFDDLFLQ